MKVQALENTLKNSGFQEDPLDSGCNYIKKVGHITFICYVEPGIEVEFIVIYQWKNNDVKGAHNISLNELSRSHQPIETFFRLAKNDMPPYVGEFTDTHDEVEKAIGTIQWHNDL